MKILIVVGLLSKRLYSIVERLLISLNFIFATADRSTERQLVLFR